MRILIAASEAVPFCKTGGLADVVGALAQKLGSAGHDVCLFLPKYRAVSAAPLQTGLAQPLEVPLGGSPVHVTLRYMQHRKASVYFLECPPLFDRDGLYGDGGVDHPDNDLRFSLFSRAVLAGAKAVGFKPDIVHSHDWQTALVPAYLEKLRKSDPFFAGAASVLTLHNMAYQGQFPAASAARAGFGPEDMAPERFEFYGKFNFLKAGLVTADALTTVSPNYAVEIQGERGFGLEGILSARKESLHGILNGIDLEVWNPERDALLPARFSADDWRDGKRACRRALFEECGLSRPELPLIGIVARLDRQKGLDLGIEALRPRLDRARVACIGDGDPALRAAFSKLAEERPEAVCFRPGFDEGFAHRVYAGSDLFLMPSRFEPCGLGQLIAMRYGAVPVVSRTGGLADTVREAAEGDKPANGFVASPDDAADLGRALDRALARCEAGTLGALAEAGLRGDYSWERSTERYLRLYAELGRRS